MMDQSPIPSDDKILCALGELARGMSSLPPLPRTDLDYRRDVIVQHFFDPSSIDGIQLTYERVIITVIDENAVSGHHPKEPTITASLAHGIDGLYRFCLAIDALQYVVAKGIYQMIPHTLLHIEGHRIVEIQDDSRALTLSLLQLLAGLVSKLQRGQVTQPADSCDTV